MLFVQIIFKKLLLFHYLYFYNIRNIVLKKQQYLMNAKPTYENENLTK